jgi:hypothetical protein
MAVSWVRQIGINTGALQKYSPSNPPKPGSLLRYCTPGSNNDHVEWLLAPMDANGNADHGGGGRSNNAITEGTGDVRSSWGRPLVEWWDPDLMGIPVLTQEAPEPTPPPPPPMVVPVPPPPMPAPGPSVPVPTKSGFQAIIDAITWLVKALLKPRS